MADPVPLTAAYTEIAGASLDFACQCDGVDGFEVIFSDSEPAPTARGLWVRGGDIFRRDGLRGRAWARLPAKRRSDNSNIYIIGTIA
ncbi:hypothetical protein [Thiocapsa sp. UBA6158]|jgi:hypothetical protein|uniref:hypothetical protein n=1 Tax=Thiocapsa sp. UBA6158 TaxID=1947692 RepID=UPI0025F4B6A1|nr:hypothetical protein [Thiocapsa sp. UBA6158]